ncbi:MAG TPA: hypothetical protein VEW68_09015 [Patescibacteria group bacterium]|nr:hypothetical protein [Patescibacteria group bacterium]
MTSFWRSVGRWDPLRVAAAGSAAAVACLVAAYIVTAVASQATFPGVVAAGALLAIGGAGLLYAWRLEAGGLVE